MPGGFPIVPEHCNGQAISISSNVGLSVVSSASTNTKGAYAQVIASTVYDACYMVITAYTIVGDLVAFDIAVGASGSEIIILNNLLVYGATSSVAGAPYAFPCNIPAGSRIAARAASTTGSGNVRLAIQIFDGAFQSEGIAGVDALGFVAATTRGTLMVSTAFTQIIAATARDYAGISYFVDDGTAGSTFSGNIDVAVGLSGSEKVIVPAILSVFAGTLSSGTTWNGTSFPQNYWVPIPKGSRISGRWNQSAVGTQAPDLTVYGIYL